MKIIAHRGNVVGPSDKENHPKYIAIALSLGFDVEVDVWYLNGYFYLGHDEPLYKIGESYLENKKMWCHAKNLDALSKMLNNNRIRSFWHENDRRTLTSDNFIWTYPNVKVCDKSVIVHLDNDWKNKYDCYAVCTDYCF